MEFVETPTFTRLVLGLMEDEDYARIQVALARRPDLGRLISGRRRLAQTALVGKRARETWRFACHLLLADLQRTNLDVAGVPEK